VRAARARFGPGARRHAGILLDIMYDHALARDWTRFADEPLGQFADRSAQALAAAGRWFGPPGAPVPHRFVALLVSYGTEAGFRLAVERTAQRLRRPQGLLDALAEWPRHQADAGADLAALLPDLERAARAFLAGPVG